MSLTERFRRDLPTEYLAMVAIIAFTMAVPGQPSSSFLVIIGTIGLVAAVGSRWSDDIDAIDRIIRLASFGTMFLVGYSLWVHSNPYAELVDRSYPVEFAWALPLLLTAGWIAFALHNVQNLGERAFRTGVIACVLAIGWAVAAQSASATLSPTPPIDVIDMHVAGSDSLWSGGDPYSDPVVYVSNPYADPGAYIEGYFYPPSALVTHAVSLRFLGDARWVSVIAALAFVALLLLPVVRGSRRFALGVIGAVSLFVSNHSFELMINSGWTDLLALPFLLGSAMTWRSRPVASAILLGCALSTKEYFIVLLPVLLLVSDSERWKRLAYAGAVVALTYLPFAIMDPSVLVPRSLQLISTDRPDSLALAGYGLSIPPWISVLLGIACAVYVARRVDSTSTEFLGFAAVLSVVFLTGVQAFMNYWIAVAGVVLIAVWLWLRDADASLGRAATLDQREAVA